MNYWWSPSAVLSPLSILFILLALCCGGSDGQRKKYLYEGPDGCNSKDCLCTTHKKVVGVNPDGSAGLTLETYKCESYSGPGAAFIQKLPAPLLRGMNKFQHFMITLKERAKQFYSPTTITTTGVENEKQMTKGPSKDKAGEKEEEGTLKKMANLYNWASKKISQNWEK